MKLRVFLDTNVFIYSFEYPESNSAKVINLLNKGQIEGIISEQVVKEVIQYFERYHNAALGKLFRRYLLESCIIICKKDVFETMDKYKAQIKEKDLEQLAVTKQLGIKYLIAYDRDFNNFEEYITPKKFVQLLKEKEHDSEF